MIEEATLLKASLLSHRFGKHVAVNNVNLAIREGELCCLIGPNGAGKTTLLRLLAGSLRPTSGQVILQEIDITGEPMHSFARRGILRKYQHPRVIPSLSVRENIILATKEKDKQVRAALVSQVIQDLSLTRFEQHSAGNLSHGQKQWLEIGMLLASRPRVLLLDEPTAGLSEEEALQMVRLVRGLTGTVATVIIDHNMQFVANLDARTIVMNLGTIIAEGPFLDIRKDPVVQRVYLGQEV